MGSQRVGHDWTTFTFIFHFAVDFLFSIPQCPSLLIHIISFLLLSLLWLLMVHAQPLHLCPSLCDPMDCSLPGSSVHGIFQTRILEWVAVPTSRGSSQPRDQTCTFCVSCIAGGFFIAESLGKPPNGSEQPLFSSSLPHYFILPPGCVPFPSYVC